MLGRWPSHFVQKLAVFRRPVRRWARPPTRPMVRPPRRVPLAQRPRPRERSPSQAARGYQSPDSSAETNPNRPSRSRLHRSPCPDLAQCDAARPARDHDCSGEGPRFLIHDNDDKFGRRFDAVAEGTGFKMLRTPLRAPNANAVWERFLRSVRNECMDHVLILGEDHFRSLLEGYREYSNGARPYQGIGQRAPNRPPDHSDAAGAVVETPVLGGLHHGHRLAA